MTSNDSKAITVIRYPLIIMVTMVHLYFGEWNRAFYDLPVFGFLTGRLLPTITQGAVPAFFFISGYLFFSQPGFNREVYLGKMRRRLGRLLKPYIVWNLIVLALIVLLQTLRPNALFVVHKPIADFTPGDFLACFGA